MVYSEIYFTIANILHFLVQFACGAICVCGVVVFALSKAIKNCDYRNDDELLKMRQLSKARFFCIIGIVVAVVYINVCSVLFYNNGYFNKYWDIRIYKEEGKTWQELYDEGYPLKYQNWKDR